MAAIGQPVRRVEDHDLLTGTARFTADVDTSALTVGFVRSTLAHARIESIDIGAASKVTGVVGVYTAADVGDIRGLSPIPVPDALIRPLMATDVVRFVGDIVAVVVASDQGVAEDAAEGVVIDYAPLTVVASVDAALAPGAPILHAGFASNRVLEAGEPPAGGFDDAELVVEVEFSNQRVAVAPMETNSILASPEAGGVVVHLSTQVPHAMRDSIATACGLDPAAVRVVAGAVGGGFGAKSSPDPEYLLVCRLALALGRPLRWCQTRSENLVTMHGRGQHQRVRVAAGGDGTLRAIHVDLRPDGGAYPGINHFLAQLTARMISGTYRFGQATASIGSVATNTAPPNGYRGAGRPEAACLVERVVDIVAAELAVDPADLRRRNLIGPDAFPYTTPTGAVYDSGNYGRALDRALELARYGERRAEQAARRAAGDPRLLGLGICCYVEVTAGTAPTEFADVEVHEDASVTVRVGTFAHGQGHRTTYAQIAADVLSVPLTAVRVIDGDTALVARGAGTYGSRSMQVGGSAVHVACTRVLERARALAGELFEASVEDIVRHDGGFSVAGVPGRRLGWAQLAAAAAEGAGPGERPGLFATLDWERPASTFPFGAHVAVIELDAETGAVRLVEHVAVDDCGTVINPLLADGQVHGGIAQGAAQALFEEVVYDPEGNLLTSTFVDYAFITAAELPSFTTGRTVTPTPINPLGAKGIGESGTIGATPAIHNAVVDALAHLGVRHVEMPCTPERIWRAVNGERHPLSVWRRPAPIG